MKYVEEYLGMIDSEPFAMCKDQKQFATLIRTIFEQDDLYIDEEKAEKYLSYQKYFDFDLFPWEKCLLVLMLCTFYKDNNIPRFSTLFCMVGRGAGKNGFISFLSFCLMTETHGINNYNIDIVANTEYQAKTSFNDVYNVLTNPTIKEKMRKNFYYNKECITNLRTNSQLRYKTSNAKSADGLRPGAIIFDEIHEYQNYDLIEVHTTGLGKIKNPRTFYITTQGYVRDAVLDTELKKATKILSFKDKDNGTLPFICRLDYKEEANKEECWFKSNPSLWYRPDLLRQIKKEYVNFKENPYINSSFLTKRMNVPQSKTQDVEVTSWDNILKTNKEIPYLTGYSCCVGIDYTKVSDMMSACLVFRKDGKYIIKTHSWICINSCDFKRIKAPIKEWEKQGLLTIIDDIEINPSILVEWLNKQNEYYDFVRFGIDNFRYTLLTDALSELEVNAKNKDELIMVRPSDIMKIVPVIDSLFNKHELIVGDNPLWRWATNNTCLVDAGKGNFVYDKIEPRSRKTDPFMAFVHAMIASIGYLEDEDEEVFLDIGDLL